MLILYGQECFEESSCDNLWENENLSFDMTDHLYMGTRKDESPTDTTILKEPVEGNKVEIFQNISESSKENINPAEIPIPSEKPTSIDLKVSTLPIKKKRGRKPGSKKNLLKFSTKIDYSPTLKHPENYPGLIYFNDDDDDIYLRNTSRDVMLSSTLPFQETPEYLELKEAYLSQRKASVCIRY